VRSRPRRVWPGSSSTLYSEPGLRARRGASLEYIRRINTEFPLAMVVAIEYPLGLPSDSAAAAGEFVRADFTVTFTAMKVSASPAANCDHWRTDRRADWIAPRAIQDVTLDLIERSDSAICSPLAHAARIKATSAMC